MISTTEEYYRWSAAQNFISSALGNLRGKDQYEMKNILCRYLVGHYNFPDRRVSLLEKANQEMKDKQITSTLQPELLIPTQPPQRKALRPLTMSVQINQRDAMVKCKDFRMYLPPDTLQRLRSKANEQQILSMLLRYDGMLVSTGNFWSIPPKFFEWIKRKYENVPLFEAFSCPLNSHLDRTFTLFPDVDAPFGSQGSFLTSEPLLDGTYIVNPPYTEPLLKETANRILTSLSTNKLTFYVLLPYWLDDPGIISLIQSPYLKTRLDFQSGYYIHDMLRDELIPMKVGNLFLVLSNVESLENSEIESLKECFTTR